MLLHYTYSINKLLLHLTNLHAITIIIIYTFHLKKINGYNKMSEKQVKVLSAIFRASLFLHRTLIILDSLGFSSLLSGALNVFLSIL